MPSFVIDEKCDGCKGGDKTACMYICPNDLMVLDVDRMKAYNSEPDMCWECYNCVKICPTQAIEVRGTLILHRWARVLSRCEGPKTSCGLLSSGAGRSNGLNFQSGQHRKGRPNRTAVSAWGRVHWMMNFCLLNRQPYMPTNSGHLETKGGDESCRNLKPSK